MVTYNSTSAEDWKKAWIPPTNDVNEGALGSYHVFIQKKPKTSMHMYSAIAQYPQNQTEAFMQQHFTGACLICGMVAKQRRITEINL